MLPDLNFYRHVKLDENSATPKYIQLSNSILKAVLDGKILKNEMLPSLNELSSEYGIARPTAEKVYRRLKDRGVLGAIKSKGFFIKSTEISAVRRVLLLFNKLSTHKKIIYDSFTEALGEDFQIDFYIYNNDYRLFKEILQEKLDHYSYYVIIPHFVEGGDNVHELINIVPKEKLILLDKKLKGVKGDFSAVYENFNKDIYRALVELKKYLFKYSLIKIVFPQDSYFPIDIVHGFSAFCRDYNFKHEVVHGIRSENVSANQIYIVITEEDLTYLLEKILENGFSIGKNIGVISYNETPIKRILMNGITTISTDFRKMGQLAAHIILDNLSKQVEVPFQVVHRGSL